MKTAISGAEYVSLRRGLRHNFRDFTHIDDIVEDVNRVLDRPATANADWGDVTPHSETGTKSERVSDTGNIAPAEMLDYISAMEEATGRRISLAVLALKSGGAQDTHSNVTDPVEQFWCEPTTPIKQLFTNFLVRSRRHLEC